MPKANDLTGNKYNMLTAIRDVGVLSGERAWLCQCDCGNEITVRARSLRTNHTKSCGCLFRKDYAGKKFNMLTAIKDVGRDKYNNRLWKCQCECGNMTTVKTVKLTNGYTKSCGCFQGKNHGLPKGEASFNSLYYSYKKTAEKRGYEFNLSKDEFKEITSQHCHYCNVEPAQEYAATKYSGAYLHNGIDRVDNEIGYTMENCVPCCSDCNYAKRDKTTEEFLDHIARIYENCISLCSLGDSLGST